MVSVDEMQEEIDKATSALTICHYVEWFSELLRIKYSDCPEREVDNALKVKEIILKLWNVDISKIQDAAKLLKGNTTMNNSMDEDIDKQIDDAKVACLYDIRLKLMKMDKESFSKQEICEFLDRMALDKLRNS